MTRHFLHEIRYRPPDAMAVLREFPVTICGAGSLGADLAERLARAGCARLRVIDHGRVAEHNLPTQPWFGDDIGARKATLLARRLRRAHNGSVDPVDSELTAANAACLLAGSGLVLDTFGRHPARQVVAEACRAAAIPCLHAGLVAGSAMVVWNDQFPAADTQGERPAAGHFALLTACLVAEVAVRFILDARCEAYILTERELAVLL